MYVSEECGRCEEAKRKIRKENLKMVNTEIKQRIADGFGEATQMQQLIEEMAELTIAVCRYAGIRGERAAKEAAEENLIEELADVRLVLEQVVYLHKCEGSVGEALDQDERKDQETGGFEEAAQMQKLVEKMAELTKAICKYARIHGQGQPVREGVTPEAVENNLVEKLAGVQLILEQVIRLRGCERGVEEVTEEKVVVAEKRLEEICKKHKK